MGKTVINLSISLDGYIAGNGESIDFPLGKNGAILHEWMLRGGTPLTDHIDPLYHGFFNATGSNAAVISDLFGEIGAMIFGRRTYDLVRGWGGTYPIQGVPVYVVSRRPEAFVPKGRSEISFVRDIREAVECARAEAGDKSVGIAGGKIGTACLTAGLVDEIYLHIVPIILGAGVPLFDTEQNESPVELEQMSVREGPGVTHMRYKVHR